MKKDLYGIIYKATFPNNKVYIGQTIYTLQHRKNQHKGAAKTQEESVYRAIRKYGFENLKWEEIDKCYSKEDMDNKEQYWIRYYNAYTKWKDSNGYNETMGGQSGLRLTVLSEDELQQFGEYRNSGYSLDEILEAMSITDLDRHAAWSIFNGKTFAAFTGIAERDYQKEPPRAKFKREEIDYILKRFKECGRTELIAQEFLNCKANDIRLILKGKTESGYTGITDENFYNQYMWPSLYYSQETLKLIGQLRMEQHLTSTEIYQQVGGSISALHSICSGRVLSEYTHITPLRESYKNLSAQEVTEIWEKLQSNTTSSALAIEYDVSPSAIDHIKNGYTWNSITGLPKR